MGARWLDVKRADGTHRSRQVAKDICTLSAPELFGATPPIEPLKYLLRRAARGRTFSIMRVGMLRAYAYFDAMRDMYLKLPAGTSRVIGTTCAANFSIVCAAHEAPPGIGNARAPK